MSKALAISLMVNGEPVSAAVEPRLSLADFLRQHAGQTGVHLGCEHGVCGACTIRVDGRIVRSCLTLAVQCEGQEIETIEGASQSGDIADLQQAFIEHNATQCGFCTPVMLLTAAALLDSNPSPGRDEIRTYLSGNYCRCTGYQAIIDAVEQVARARNGKTSPEAGS